MSLAYLTRGNECVQSRRGVSKDMDFRRTRGVMSMPCRARVRRWAAAACLALFASGWLSPSPAAAGWAKKVRLTFDNLGRGALIDFPFLVVVNSTRIDYADTQDMGQDIRLTNLEKRWKMGC